jgi:mannose-6-phosphate isomerase class I
VSYPRPLLLRPDNVTPPSRTPWGGRRIAERTKEGLLAPALIGESWEISVEPDFPSRTADEGRLLREVLAEAPEAWLGREAARGRTGTALLVKLLDAALDLSVQIHPADHDAALGPGESGKPESWYVVEADDGAGLYVGLREGTTRARMEAALAAGENVASLLQFVEAAPGDVFVIEAGVPHAIGRGVMVVEPQHVAPGSRGQTYRYWDWDRRYDREGRLDPGGAPRALHVAQALAATDWEGARGEAFLARARHRSGGWDPAAPARLELLCGPQAQAPLRFRWLSVARLVGSGSIALPPDDALRGLTVLAGSIALGGPGFTLEVGRGRSAVLPASLPAVGLALEAAHAVLTAAA